MVVYLDAAFLLSALADGAALYVTGRLAGLRAKKGRLLLAAVLGGIYGALGAVPAMAALTVPVVQLILAAALVALVFGADQLPRRLLLFYLTSCALGGAVTAVSAVFQQGAEFLAGLNWRIFLLAGGGCYLVLSVVFRGDARQAVAGRLHPGWVERRGRRAPITALLDTGHTLTDGAGTVLTVHWASLSPLWTTEEAAVLRCLEKRGAAWCMEQLGPGFWLLPYSAVGVQGGLLLCCGAERACLGRREMGKVTLALSPTALGAGWDALWGGEGMEKETGDAA